MGLKDFLAKLDRSIDRLGEYVEGFEQEVRRHERMRRRLLEMLEEEERREQERRGEGE